MIYYYDKTASNASWRKTGFDLSEYLVRRLSTDDDPIKQFIKDLMTDRSVNGQCKLAFDIDNKIHFYSARIIVSCVDIGMHQTNQLHNISVQECAPFPVPENLAKRWSRVFT